MLYLVKLVSRIFSVDPICIAGKFLFFSQIPVPWNEHNRSEQISLISNAMAYIHTSAKTAIEKLYSHERVHYKFFTPLTFMEFVHIFKVIGARVSREERVRLF